MASYDVAVIGGGIIGITTAFFLARRGKRVVVLERNQLAQGTTGNSFAWINASSKAAHGAYHHLNAAGLKGYNALAAEFGQDAMGLNPCGELSIAPADDAAALGALKERWRQLQDHAYPVTWIDAATMPTLEPGLNVSRGYEGILNYAEMALDAPHFVRFLATQVAASGGEVREGVTVTALDMDDAGRIQGVETSAGGVAASKVLLAAGPDSPEQLAALTGFDAFASRFPVRRVPGLLLTTPDLSPHHPSRRVIYWDEEPDLHVLPHPSGGLKMGADDTDGMISEDDSPAAMRAGGERLLARARERINGLPDDLRVDDCHLGIGRRPMPADSQSIADQLLGSEDLFLTATHSGVTLAPALGQLMAAFIDTGERPDTLAPFSLTRFPGFE